jgi:serine/threonine-protein kinase
MEVRVTETRPSATGPAGYELLNTIGEGSTGTVYLARQAALERHVAIKRLAPWLAGDAGFTERFRREAQVMASIDHPNIVRVYALVEEADATFLVAEYVEGATVRAVQREARRLSPEQSLGILQGALTGLAHAHARGLVHRDVKPENILADQHGTSKLTDFGEAASVEGIAARPAGTPAYMSPEAVAGGRIDARSDIYSAAAVLFELLTGRVPYLAESPLAVLRMHTSSPVPDPRAINPDLPRRVGAMVARGLAKDPGARFATVDAFRTELTAAASEGYGPNWERRASIAKEVAAAASAAAALAGTAATAAGGGGIGALIAAAGTVPMAVAGGLIGVVSAAAVAGGLAMTLAGHHQQVEAASTSAMATPGVTSSADPSPTDVASPSPSATATSVPSPGVRPSATPALGQPGSNPPPPAAPGRVTVSNTAIFFRTCSAPGQCFAESDGTANNTAANPAALPCHSHVVVARYLALREQYSWTYPGSGAPVTLHLAWSGRHPDGTADPGTGWDSDTAKPGKSGTHAWDSGASEYDDGSTNGQTGVGYVQYRLTWTNPDGSAGSTPLTRLYYQCS